MLGLVKVKYEDLIGLLEAFETAASSVIENRVKKRCKVIAANNKKSNDLWLSKFLAHYGLYTYRCESPEELYDRYMRDGVFELELKQYLSIYKIDVLSTVASPDVDVYVDIYNLARIIDRLEGSDY